MASLTSSAADYLTSLKFSGQYFSLGLNYLTGDSDAERLTLPLAGRYTIGDDPLLSAGIAPTNYMYTGQEDYITSIAYYFRPD